MEIDIIYRDELVKEMSTLKGELNKEYNTLTKNIESSLMGFLKENQIDDNCKIKIHNSEFIEIYVYDMKDNYHNIDIVFRPDYDYDTHSYKNKVLKYNFCSFGSFDKDNICARNYLKVLGILSAKMPEIENILYSIDFSTYESIKNKYSKYSYDLHVHDEKIKKQNEDKLKEEFLKKLVVGSKIIIGTKGSWDKDGKYHRIPDVREVTRVGNKTINISDMYSRIKKDNVMYSLCNNLWKFVEEKEKK